MSKIQEIAARHFDDEATWTAFLSLFIEREHPELLPEFDAFLRQIRTCPACNRYYDDESYADGICSQCGKDI